MLQTSFVFLQASPKMDVVPALFEKNNEAGVGSEKHSEKERSHRRHRTAHRALHGAVQCTEQCSVRSSERNFHEAVREQCM